MGLKTAQEERPRTEVSSERHFHEGVGGAEQEGDVKGWKTCAQHSLLLGEELTLCGDDWRQLITIL